MPDKASMMIKDRLAREITGEVLFDSYSRGRYATDASFYQIMPFGVVVPKTIDEALRALAIAREDGRTVTPRGGGTSQSGQTVNDGIVIDFSKHLNRVLSLDVENRSCVVEPGIVTRSLRASVDVALAPGITRGMTVVDPSGRIGTPRVTLVEEALPDRLAALYALSVAYSPKPMH